MRRFGAPLLSLLLVACGESPTTLTAPLETELFGVEAAFSLTGDRSYAFETIQVPGARFTTAWGINAGGDVVGTYVDQAFVQHGFLLRKGTYSDIDVPGAEGTIARGIGPGGVIVGSYWNPEDPPVAEYGFRLAPGGEYESVMYPGHLHTIPQRILPDGTILGCYHDENTTSTMKGVLMAQDGNQETDLYASMHNGATPDLRRIAGLYTNTVAGRTEGYVLDDGVFSPLVVPGSTLTAAWDVNPAGEVVGVYRTGTPPSVAFHGFVLTAHGYVTVDYPGATHTRAFGTNARGDVVGHYVAGGRVYGFIARRTGGR